MEPGQLTITVAQISDAVLITQLGITTFWETFADQNSKEDMDKYVADEMNIGKLTAEIADTGNTFLLAYYNDTPIGYAKLRSGKIPEQLSDRNPMELERLYVLAEYHNRKVGATLMEYCITLARNCGHDVLWLGVWEHNYRALQFYERWGFSIFDSHIFTLGTDDQTDVLMMKELN